MEPMKCSEVLQAVSGKLLCGGDNTEISNISTDSRKISRGDLFIPIVGEKFDGHDFVLRALEDGAAAVLTAKDMPPVEGKSVIRVDDTSKALRDLAFCYRQKFSIPCVGITGSVGKTSTKDMIASVLRQAFRVLKTEGNFNNEIGLPLTVFNLNRDHEAAVLEMGMSGFGEISRLTAIARPDIAVITNIGVSHIEKLGSRQNILRAKMEILEGLSEKGLVVLNGDDNLLGGLKGLLKFRTVFYGMEEGLDYQAYNVKTAGEKGTYFEIMWNNREYIVHIPVPGVHHVHNALAAIAVGLELNIPMEEIVRGIEGFSSGKMRMDITTHGSIKIINDAYNASPQSMHAALDVLKEIGNGRRTIAVLGDMLEMGNFAPKAHLDVGRYAASKGIDLILAVGDQGRAIVEGALASGVHGENVFSCGNNEEMKAYLKDCLKSGDTILVKGSRSMRMEEIVQYLTQFDI